MRWCTRAGKSSETRSEQFDVVGLHASSGVTRDLAGPPSRFAAATAGLGARMSAARLAARALLWLGIYQCRARLRAPSAAQARDQLARWSRRAWSDLHLDVRVSGTPPPEPHVYVANHRSYLDIVVLSGVCRGTFLSRADVAQWPLIGTVAKGIEAVFVDRDDAGGRVRALRELMRRIGSVSLVAFPEGTTTGEPLPAPFHPGLFRVLRRLEAPVVPITIRYSDRRAYWTEDIALGEHLRTRVLAGPRLNVTVHIGGELDSRAYADGSSFAYAAHAAVCRPIAALGEFS
jgi:1-acyl-sn-glycerol-3-phosphate acyltransferase